MLQRKVQDAYARLGAVRHRCWTRHACPGSVRVIHKQTGLADALVAGCGARPERCEARIECGAVGALPAAKAQNWAQSGGVQIIESNENYLDVACSRLICARRARAATLVVDNPLPDGALALARAVCEDCLLEAVLADALGNCC